MVSDPPTPCERSRWRASITIALSAVTLACSSLLDIPGDPYVVEAPPAPVSSDTPDDGEPSPGGSLEPDGPSSPDIEIDDVQDSSGSSGANTRPGDAGVPRDGAVSDVSDAAVPIDATPPPDAAATCPAGATLGPSGRCYVAVRNTLTAPAAQSSCGALGNGWELAAVHDAATNAFLGTLIDVEAWIGASDNANEGTWVWVIDDITFWNGDGDTGVPVNGQFDNWAGGEPNGEDTSDCARLVPDPPRWADLECDSLRASLCEGPPL